MAVQSASSSASTLVLTRPTVVVNDVLIAQISLRSAATINAVPAGWQLINQSTQGSVRQAIYYKIATASEPASYTWTFSTAVVSAGGVLSYRGVEIVSSPFDVTAVQSTTSSGTLNYPGVSVASSGTFLLAFGGAAQVATISVPSAMTTERYDRNAGTGASGIVVAMAEQPLAGAGAMAAKSATLSTGSADNIGHVVVLRPIRALSSFAVEAAGGGALGTQTAGTPFNIRITARDQDGFTLTSFGSLVNVTSSGYLLSGGPVVSGFASGVIASHSVTLSSSGTAGLTVTRPGGVETGSSNVFTVNPSASALSCGTPPWYHADWTLRKPLTVNAAQVAGSLSNFPVLISHTDNDLRTKAQASGNDILFTAADGVTRLAHEIEQYTSASGALIAWVRVPALSSTTDATIYMYYGNAAAASQQNAASVWDEGFRAVWHLRETGNGTANEFSDSSALGNHGRGGNGVAARIPTVVAGKIGNAQSFDGGDVITRMTGVSGLPTLQSDQTMSIWYRVATNFTNRRNFLTVRVLNGSLAHQMDFWGNASGGPCSANNLVIQQWGGACTIGTTPPAAAVWHQMVYTRSGATNRLYIDGALRTTNTQGVQSGAEVEIIFGSYEPNASEAIIGLIDESRLSNTPRSDAWIATEYNNQNAPASFYGVGSEQPQYCGPDHFLIDVGASSASTCVAKPIRITAVDAANNPLTTYTGTMNLSTSSNRGDWSLASGFGVLANGAANDGIASYTFAAGDNGVVDLNLGNHSADDLTISATDSQFAATVSTSGSVNFRDNAFVVSVSDALGDVPVAGRDHALSVVLWRKDPNTGNCAIATGYTGNRALKAWSSLNPSHPAGASAPAIGALSVPTSMSGANNLSLNFSAGQASFNLSSSDVGKYALNLRDDNRSFASGVDIDGGSPTLTVRPFALHVGVTGNTGANTPGGAILTSAGSDFSASVRAVLWQASDDANSDGLPDAGANLADNGVAPRYAWATSLVAAAPFEPAAGVLGALNNGPLAPAVFTAGAANLANLQYTEVGSFNLRATAADYLNSAGVDVGDGGGMITGRFTPHDFAVTYNSPEFGTACATGAFTYVGQRFAYTTAPVIGVTARNRQGATTRNYTGAWWKLGNATLTGRTYTAASGNLDTSGLPNPDPVVADTGNGTGTVNFAAGTGLHFVRTTPVALFDADIALSINVVDADAIAYASNPARFGSAAAGGGIAFNGGKQMRFGRLRLLNALGSELIDLPVPAETQYWNGAGFITNGADSCTTLAKVNVTLANFQKNLAACETSFDTPPGAVVFNKGKVTLLLHRPGAGNDGSVDLLPNLAGSASGNACLNGASTAASSAVLPHLQGNWDGGSTYDDNPRARGTFGLRGSASEFIYFRENY